MVVRQPQKITRMFCTKCGADNKMTATFCSNCGDPVESEQETQVAIRHHDKSSRLGVSRADDEQDTDSSLSAAARMARQSNNNDGMYEGDAEAINEVEIFSIHPTLIFVKAGYVLTAVAALLLVAIVNVFLPAYVSTWVAVLLGLVLFSIPAFYHFKQKLVRYTLKTSTLQIDAGLFTRSTRNLPLGRIQDVTVYATLIQRILGFGNIVVDNASEEDGKAVLKNINSPKHYADVLLRQMRNGFK